MVNELVTRNCGWFYGSVIKHGDFLKISYCLHLLISQFLITIFYTKYMCMFMIYIH